ncbi:MAG: BCCT family transporter [Pseudomonadota bacterium]
MDMILSVAIVVTLLTSLLLIVRFGKMRLTGTDPMPLMAFMAILFTSGLDVGLIMFPMTEFPVYETEDVYGFTNALAVEFGFWGFLVWGFYFLTTFYFCIVEPKVQLFEIRWVKLINSAVIIATCAFTGFLFLSYLPDYIIGLSDTVRYVLVAVVVLMAVLSSTDIRYVKWLSIGSSALFFCLIALLWISSDVGVPGLLASLSQLGGYFANLPRFVHPVSDYHAFYLFWWFAWSIMIGQFVARFVNGLRAYQLLTALLVIPSILIALWFSVLYVYHSRSITLSNELQMCMVMVGVIFVVNSLDSLTRLYSENLGLTVQRLGNAGYIGLHWTLLFSLILLYQFTALKIEWIGLVVIGLYCAAYVLTFIRRDALMQQTA